MKSLFINENSQILGETRRIVRDNRRRSRSYDEDYRVQSNAVAVKIWEFS